MGFLAHSFYFYRFKIIKQRRNEIIKKILKVILICLLVSVNYLPYMDVVYANQDVSATSTDTHEEENDTVDQEKDEETESSTNDPIQETEKNLGTVVESIDEQIADTPLARGSPAIKQSRTNYTLSFGKFLDVGTGEYIYASGANAVTVIKDGTKYNRLVQELFIDGEHVFCLEPIVLTEDGAGYDIGNIDEYMSWDEMYNIGLIAYFGYGYQGDYSDDMQAATQIAVWQARVDDVYDYTSNVQAKINLIRQRIKNFYVTVSFGNGNYDLQGYGESNAITLTDKNGVLSDFHVTDNGGFQIQKNGNNLTLWANKGSAIKSSFALSRMDESRLSQPIVYKNPDAKQTVAKLGFWDPETVNVNIRIAVGNLKIQKVDEDNIPVPNTKFRVSYSQQGLDGTKNKDFWEYTTGADGSVTIEDLKLQTVYYREESVSEQYVLDKTVHSAKIEYNKTISVIAKNNYKKGKIQIAKRDAETGNIVKTAGTVFDIYRSSDNALMESITTGADGIATSNWLRYAKNKGYYYLERTAPDKYTHSNEKRYFDITENGKLITDSFHNIRVKATITITKTDKETGNTPQGDASLNGAVYGLYARTPILAPDTHKVLYTKDQLISTMTIKDQKATLNNLYLGEVYVKEISPSVGYLLDSTEYDMSLSYEGQNTVEIKKSQTVKEQVKKQAFEIIKISSDGESGETPTLEGVEFTVKLASEVDRLGWNNARTYDVLKTNKKGWAKSIELPYGKWIVKETKPLPDTLPIKDFTVSVNEDNREPQQWRVFNNAPFKAFISIVKMDKETGEVVAVKGAKFKIKDLDTNEYIGQWSWFPIPTFVTTFETTEQGTVTLPSTVKGGSRLQLEEIASPYGYQISRDPIQFTVSDDSAYQIGPDGVNAMITVVKSNVSTKGRITVEKQGESLISAHKDKDDNTVFKYENRPQKGAKFALYAKGDIFSADNQGNIIYRDGEFIQNLVTGDDGKATTKDLPLNLDDESCYVIKEVSPPSGFTLSAEEKIVKLKYDNQEESVVFEEIDFMNDRQKVKIDITKKDVDTEEPIQGAMFALFADEDIKNYDGDIIIKKDSILEISTSDKDGKVLFDIDLPLTKVRVKELKPSDGYVSNDDILRIDATEKNQQSIKSFDFTIYNKQTTTEISKVDVTTMNELPGAALELKNDDGKVIETWISGSNPHIIKGLKINSWYVLSETSSPHGFTLSADVRFYVNDTAEIQKVEMINDLTIGKLSYLKKGLIFNEIDKTDDVLGTITKPVFNMEYLSGYEIKVYAAEDIIFNNHVYYEKDQEVDTLESDLKPVLSKDLLVGKYYYVESNMPHTAFLMDKEKHYFEITDNQTTEIKIVESELENKLPKIQIDFTKAMETNEYYNDKDAYKDVRFGIFTRDDTYDYYGKVLLPYDSLISVLEIDENGNLKDYPEYLPVGNFYLKELATSDAHILNDTELDFSIGKTDKEVQTIVLNDGKGFDNKLKRTNIIIHKIDKESKQPLEGATFSLMDAYGNIIGKSKSDKDGIAIFKDLPNGNYTIFESATGTVEYTLNRSLFYVQLDGNSENNEYHLTIENERYTPVNTGVSLNGKTYTYICIVALGVLLVVIQRRKKH